MNILLPALFLVILNINVRNISCRNLVKQYFITFNMDILGRRPVDIIGNMALIENTVCNRSRNSSVTCFRKFKVIGEPRAIVVVNVMDSVELEDRLSSLTASGVFHYTSEPVVEYDIFAKFLGVDESIIIEGNTLENVPEALWCEYDVNFGDKSRNETLDLWKREAEVVYNTRKAGIPMEIFKTVVEKRAHLFIEEDAVVFDQLSFGTPFSAEIASTVKTTCKAVVQLKALVSDRKPDIHKGITRVINPTGYRNSWVF